MTSRPEARSLLHAVETARSSTRGTLQSGTADIALLFIAQFSAMVVALGHTTNSGSDLKVYGFVAATFCVVAAVNFRERARLGTGPGAVRVVLPLMLFIADVVINFGVHGTGELVARAIGLGIAGLLLGAISRNPSTLAYTGVFALIPLADALGWSPGPTIAVVAVWLGLLVLAFRKRIPWKT